MTALRRILHLDDDPQMTELVAGYLQEYGYTTTALHDPCLVIQQLPRLPEAGSSVLSNVTSKQLHEAAETPARRTFA